MARFSSGRFSFQLGEVSPAAVGRADTNTYHQMCEELKNMIPRSSGGASRRMGTTYLPDTNDGQINSLGSVSALKMIPFPTSYDSSLFLILTDTYAKAYSIDSLAYGGSLSHLGTIAKAVTKTYGFTNDWSPTPTFVGYSPLLEQYAQFGDTVVITNGVYRPLVVYGTSAGREKYFLWGEGSLQSDGTVSTGNLHTLIPFDSDNTGATTMTLSNAAVGSRTLTASVATFTSAMVGRYIRGHDSGTVGLAVITAYTSTTVVTVEVLQAFFDTTLSTVWAWSQWGGDRGWPRAVTFFEQRIMFGGNTYMPDGIWASQIGDMFELSLLDPTATLGNADCYNARIGQANSGYINHLFPIENLFANSEEKENYLSPVDDTVAVGATNIQVLTKSHYGCGRAQPVGVEEQLIFPGGTIGVSGYSYPQKLLELSWNRIERDYQVLDLTRYARDITRDRRRGTINTYKPHIKGLAYMRAPDTIIWCLDTSGKLYSLTRDKDAETFAWAHHTLGGEYVSDEPQVQDVISIRGKLIIAVARAIDGDNLKLCFEMMAPEFVADELDSTAVYLDFAKTASVTAGGKITGLTHVTGSTVHVVANGEYLGTYDVSGGDEIDVGVEYATQIAIVGLSYESVITPIALDSNALFGTGLGSIKRIEKATVYFERSVAAKVGIIGNEDNEEEIQFRDSTVNADDPTPLYTGEKEVEVSADYERRQNIYIKQDKPFPMTVNFIVLKGILYD